MVLPKYLYYVPFFFSLAGFALLFVGTGCSFVEFQSAGTQVDDLTTGTAEPATLRFGLWYYESYVLANRSSSEVDANATSSSAGHAAAVLEGSCTLYPEDEISVDDRWKAARTLSLIAMIAGGSVLFLDVFQGCVSSKRTRSFRTGAVGYFVSGISSALTLLMLRSDVCVRNVLVEELNRNAPGLDFPSTCSMSRGAKSAVAAAALFLAASAGTALLHPVQARERKEEEEKGRGSGGDDDDGLDAPLFVDAQDVL